MKKIGILAIISIFLLAVFGLFESGIFARLTGNTPSAPDAFCVGQSGSEVCVDSSGNVIPTTNNDADLGTPSLKWKDLYVSGTSYMSSISGSGVISGISITATSGNIGFYPRTLTQINAITPTAVGQAYYCSDCTNSAVCISSGTGLGAFVQIGSKSTHCS